LYWVHSRLFLTFSGVMESVSDPHSSLDELQIIGVRAKPIEATNATGVLLLVYPESPCQRVVTLVSMRKFIETWTIAMTIVINNHASNSSGRAKAKDNKFAMWDDHAMWPINTTLSNGSIRQSISIMNTLNIENGECNV